MCCSTPALAVFEAQNLGSEKIVVLLALVKNENLAHNLIKMQNLAQAATREINTQSAACP